MNLRSLLPLPLAFLVSACSSTQIIPKGGQQVFYRGGTPIVMSSGKNSNVQFVPLYKDQDGRINFNVAVENRGGSVFTVGLEDIRATYRGKPLRIYTRAEVERHARVKAGARAFAVAMNGVSASVAASMPQQTYYSGNYNGSSNYYVQGANGSANIYGRQNGTVYGSSTTYNPAATVAAQQAAMANTRAGIGSIQQDLASELQGSQSVFGRTTMFPHMTYGGIVLTHNAREIDFVVRAGGDEHRAGFIVK